MCCDATETLNLPADVIEALAHYRRLLGDHGADWGENSEMFGLAGFSLIGPTVAALMATGDLSQAIRTALGDDVPAGVAVVRIDQNGALKAEVGPARTAIVGRTVRLDVVIDSAASADLQVSVNGRDVPVQGRAAAIAMVDVDGSAPVVTVEVQARRSGSRTQSDRLRRPNSGSRRVAAPAGGLTRAWAHWLAPHRIRVNSVHPHRCEHPDGHQ